MSEVKTTADTVETSPAGSISQKSEDNEKKAHVLDEKVDAHDIEVAPGYIAEKDVAFAEIPIGEGVIPDDKDHFIDPRLKDYSVPLVAKTVDLHNDPT